MKKTMYFSLVAFLVIMGCSKDLPISDTNENNQLKNALYGNSLYFYGNSIIDSKYFTLVELSTGGKIMKKGKCSGSIKGYGKINPDTTFTYYKFTSCTGRTNPVYGVHWRQCEYIYDLSGEGRVSVSSINYFNFSFTNGLYTPANYEAGYTGPGEPEFYGAIFDCPTNSQGEATITFGAGKFKTFAGRKLEISTIGGGTGINRVTGEMNLLFKIK